MKFESPITLILGLLIIWGVTYFALVGGDENVSRYLPMEGEGRIVKKMNRSGEQSGLWVELEDGTEIGIPPTKLWDIIKSGDYIEKHTNSFIYKLNDREYDMRVEMKRASSNFWIVGASVLSLMFAARWLVEFDATIDRSQAQQVLSTRHVQITPNRQGVSLVIAHPRNLLISLHILVYTGGLMLAMAFAGIPVSSMIIGTPEMTIDPLIATPIFLAISTPALIYLLVLLIPLLRKEHITLVMHTLTIQRSVLGIGRTRVYHIEQLHHFHMTSSDKQWQGTLCFDYQDSSPRVAQKMGHVFNKHSQRTVFFGKKLESNEADSLVNRLSDILTYRCHAVDTIVFGEPSHQEDVPYTESWNPDVSDLTMPFYHLKRIIIQTTNYKHQTVERFLTYAINVIGQEYLKHHVDVMLCGAPEQLHVNLRNNLTNLCKSISCHSYEDPCYERRHG